MSKKYDFVEGDTLTLAGGAVLHRIRAVRDIPRHCVKAGDLGGYIEKRSNLSEESNAWVSGDALVSGNAWVYGDARVYGDAQIEECSEVGCFSNVGSQKGTLTYYRTKKGIGVSRGCFSGTLEEFESAVNEKHGDNQYGREYRHLIAFIQERASAWKKEGV